MKHSLGVLGIFVLISYLLLSCKPDFDLTGSYKDVTIVYGLLNINADTNYLKIYKGYLSEDNALIDAKNKDSLYYYKKIDVYMDEYNGSNFIRRIELDTTTSIPKDSGLFAYPNQLLYYTTATLNADYTYELIIFHKESGYTVKGSTKLVPYFSFINPSPSGYLSDSCTKEIDIATLSTQTNGAIRFSPPNNSLMYDIYLYFYYDEANINTPNIITNTNVVKYKMGRLSRSSLNDVNSLILRYYCHNIYKNIAALIPVSNQKVRYFNHLKFEICAAGTTYTNYINLSNTGGSLVQDRLRYTNLASDSENNNALGIFSSISNTILICPRINNASVDSLVKGSLSSNLNFKKSF